MESRFTAVFQKTDKWWIAFVEELPGANTQGKTIDEARENLKEAVELMLKSNRELSERDLLYLPSYLQYECEWRL
ncbi:MAG: type II toxin-antitoxin system HicB family antitoxin [Methanosarcinales archaeon]|nr:MAG: type II toxin-antitoxin system HicB family antitoxin [Methanosarcinales archaeon]